MAVTREKVVALAAAVIVATVVPGTLGYASGRIAKAERSSARYADVSAAGEQPIEVAEPCRIEPRRAPPLQAGGRPNARDPARGHRGHEQDQTRDRGYGRWAEKPTRPVNVRKPRRPRAPKPGKPPRPSDSPRIPETPLPSVTGPSRLPLAPTHHQRPPSDLPDPDLPSGRRQPYGTTPAPSMTAPPPRPPG